ncbi:DUF350 domain-containing protein [Arenimonas composti]|uniref:DUF350 domain-containing protein n=1 Tax=Arenimonas composti TR7-09 = DSM 18010 TaxID=1121013 RepID=A0A091C1R1_9GAMM|nr:DUF350 domain-containing protein [Arenimonas composti]KFN50565.1 hypothetical protein P873_05240 [Arenimonas composti TR7-09 = DSM 18010]
MTVDFLLATFFNLGVNIVQTLIALIVAVLGLQFIDHKLLRHIDIEQELAKGNIAVSIFASTILIFVALVVVFGLRG